MSGVEIATISVIGGILAVLISQGIGWLRGELDKASAFRSEVTDAKIDGLQRQIQALDAQLDRMTLAISDRIAGLDTRITRMEARHDLRTAMVEVEEGEGRQR